MSVEEGGAHCTRNSDPCTKVASVLKFGRSLGVLGEFPKLLAYQDRIFERPAYQKAIADQCEAFAANTAADMKCPA